MTIITEKTSKKERKKYSECIFIQLITISSLTY